MKRISIVGWMAFTITFLVSHQTFAREWVESYINARSQAMGGVQVALTSDDTSLYRNPANLGSLRGFSPTLFDPEIEISKNFFGQVNSAAALKTFDVEKVNDILSSDLDNYYHAKFQLTPTFSVRHFSLGILYRNEMSAIKSNLTTMDTQAYEDLGLVLGLNYNFWSGRIKLGASLKAINRIEVNDPALDTTGSLSLGTIASEGTALTGDVGLILQAPVVYLPTLAIVARDIGDTKYDSSSGLRLDTGSRRPQVVKESYDAGISIMPIHSSTFRSVWSIEYRDIQDSREEDFSQKRMHAGFELNWADLFFVRAGYNQGYYTAGLELAGERVSWQLTTYSEEVGTKDSKKEDRRYSTKIAVRF